jgi:hypothetical protein
MKWQKFCAVPEMGVTNWPFGAGFAIQADAPSARVVGFAPLSLTVDVVGERGELQVLRLAQDDNEQSFKQTVLLF